MTPYQQAVALGNILKDDDCDLVQTFDSIEEAMAAVENMVKNG